MQKRITVLLTLVMLFVMFYNGLGQGINMAEWKVLSDENKTIELTDTVFLGNSCVTLDGNIKSAIWNKSANLKNFRMELDVAGAVMSGVGFHVSNDQNYQFIYFRP